ncbi:MAG: polysaccharide biosynthesis/export family protein [Gemmataceae bacterium]
MSIGRKPWPYFVYGWLMSVCLLMSGCLCRVPVPRPAPRELALVPHPAYIVEPPDFLLVDAIRLVPRPPYKVQPMDTIAIQVFNLPAEEPINGLFPVAPDGTINLGFSYGSVSVSGMTLEEVKQLIDNQLKEAHWKTAQVRVTLGQMGGIQLIRGEHLVRPDGTVGLGIYGNVFVCGMTLEQAKAAIEQQLSQYFLDPQISIDVSAYNSKWYYIIADGAGYGQQILRFPVTGKETVLDAISQIYGLPLVSSKHKIWVARPDPSDCRKQTILPVDWVCLTEGGSPATNYQLLANDRVYIQAQALITTNNSLAKAFAPLERIFGITLLGSSAVQGIQYNVLLAQQGANGIGGIVSPGGAILR